MPDQDVFGNETQTNQSEDPTQSNTNPFEDKLKGIVNDKGEQKYKTVEDALEALNHSQQFIETLKQEAAQKDNRIAELGVEVNTLKAVEDIVKDLKPNVEPVTTVQDPKPVDNGLNEDKVAQLIKDALDNTRQNDVRNENKTSVANELAKLYGDKTGEVVSQKAKELNMKPSDLGKMSEENPALVLSLFKDVKVENTSPTKTSIQSNPNQVQSNDMPTTDKNLITGAVTEEDRMDAWNKVKDYTYKNLGVES